MATTQSDSSSPPPGFFHEDLCIWELVDHDDDDDSLFGVQSLDSFPSSSSDHDCDYDEILETSRPGIDHSLPDSIEQDSDVNEADGDDDDDACGVSGFYSASIDTGQNPVLELESLGQFIEPDGFWFGMSAEIDHEEMGNGLCENGFVDDSNGDGGEEHDVVGVDDTGSCYVDLGQNPFLEWDSLNQFIVNAILGASKQVGSDSTRTALDDVNAGVGMSSRNDCEDVNGIYVNEDHSDHDDVLGGYHSDHEVKADLGTSSNVQEVGVSGSPICGHPRGYDAIICQQPSGSDHEELIVNQVVEHDDSDDDVPNDDDDEEEEENMDMDESDGAYDLDDELVPWGLSHQLRGQRMRKLAKRPCAKKMTKAKRTARIYVNRGCIHGKHSVGLIEAC